MFSNHPKGLPVLFFTELWERFGFYLMFMIPYNPITHYNLFGIKIDVESIVMGIIFVFIFAYVHKRLEKENKSELDIKEFSKLIGLVILFSLLIGRAWYYFLQIPFEGMENIIRFLYIYINNNILDFCPIGNVAFKIF